LLGHFFVREPSILIMMSDRRSADPHDMIPSIPVSHHGRHHQHLHISYSKIIIIFWKPIPTFLSDSNRLRFHFRPMPSQFISTRPIPMSWNFRIQSYLVICESWNHVFMSCLHDSPQPTLTIMTKIARSDSSLTIHLDSCHVISFSPATRSFLSSTSLHFIL
jgi:hypothetical protein